MALTILTLSRYYRNRLAKPRLLPKTIVVALGFIFGLLVWFQPSSAVAGNASSHPLLTGPQPLPAPAEPALAGTEWRQENDSPANKSDFREFLAQHKIPVRDDIIAALKEAQRRASSAGKGHVVIGQVDLPPRVAHAELVCQGSVLKGGYVVDAVQTPGMPIWFWHPRCGCGQLLPQSGERGTEWLGKVRLKRDKRRAQVQGIARVNQFAVPDRLECTAEYSPGFVNSIGSDTKKLEALAARLSELAQPVVEVDPQTGEFMITEILDAPIKFELSGKGPERFSTAVHPSMDQTLDMGACELHVDPIRGALPDIDGLDLAEEGLPKLKVMLDQVQQQSGNSQAAILFVEQLSRTLRNVIASAERHLKANGERSAVALIMTVNLPGVDLSQIKSSLRASEALYAVNGRANRAVPRILYGVVKPGTRVRVGLPGFLPFEYQVRGSRDGVEVVEAKFKPIARRDLGRVRGRVRAEAGSKNSKFGVQLYAIASPHIGPSGVASKTLRGTNERVELLSSMTNGKLEFPQLPPGRYAVRVWGASTDWPRELRFLVEPGQRLELPDLTLYEMPPVQFETMHAFRGTGPRTLSEAELAKLAKDFMAEPKSGQTIKALESWGRGTVVQWGGGYFDPKRTLYSGNGLGWDVTPRGGNSVSFRPLLRPGFTPYDEPKAWSVIRLGTAEPPAYSAIQVRFGSNAAGASQRAFPENPIRQDAPFQLARGQTYLIQHSRAGFAILVRVR